MCSSFEGTPRERADFPVDAERMCRLEVPNRLLGDRSKLPVGWDERMRACKIEELLHLSDLTATRATLERRRKRRRKSHRDLACLRRIAVRRHDAPAKWRLQELFATNLVFRAIPTSVSPGRRATMSPPLGTPRLQ